MAYKIPTVSEGVRRDVQTPVPSSSLDFPLWLETLHLGRNGTETQAAFNVG